jgi:hypothetical protein
MGASARAAPCPARLDHHGRALDLADVPRSRPRPRSKVTICYTAAHQTKVAKIIRDLKLGDREDIVVIDARSDNKPSASKA